MLSNKKIMVVDDNQMNRLIAASVIKRYGADVVEAFNEKDAVGLLALEDVDLVLIDIEAQKMDGAEAVRCIREKAGKSLPVIALSSGIINGNLEKYVEAGMNDFLHTPFKEKALLEKIAFWLNKNIDETLGTGPEKVCASVSLYNLSTIRDLCGDDEDFIKKMVKIFMELTPAQIEEMEENYLRGDYKAMGKVAHKIKPSLDSMGIESLKGPIREIEKKGGEEMDDGSISFLLGTVKSTIGQVMDSLKNDFPN